MGALEVVMHLDVELIQRFIREGDFLRQHQHTAGEQGISYSREKRQSILDGDELQCVVHHRHGRVAQRKRTNIRFDELHGRIDQELGAADPEPATDGEPDLILRGTAHQLARKYGPKGDILLRTQNRLDAFFLHTAFGGVAFFAIMYLLFQSIFTWAAPAMDGVEAGLGWLSDQLVPLLGPTLLQDFAADAIFSGLGAFLVMQPISSHPTTWTSVPFFSDVAAAFSVPLSVRIE